MTGRIVLGAAAVALLAAGFASGTLAGIVASPLALGVALLARRDSGEAAADAPYVAGAAAAASVLAVALGVAAQGVGGGLAAFGAAALLGRFAYLVRPDPRDGSHVPVEILDGPPLERAAGLLSVWLDDLARCAWRLRFRARSGTSLEAMAAGVRRLAAHNAETQTSAGAEAFHGVPPLLEKPQLTPGPRGLLLRFESTLEGGRGLEASVAAPPGGEADIGSVRRTSDAAPMAQALLLQHDPASPRPTVVCIHSLSGGQTARESRRFDVSGLMQTGLDVVLLTLPEHGARRGRARWHSGDPARVSELVAQSVFDLRRLLGWLRREGVPAIGLYGEQLGGTVAGLTAACDRRIAAVVVRSTPASLADPWLAELGERDRLALSAMGLTRAVLEDAFRSSAVLSCEPRLPTDSLLIVAGARDRICTPDQTRALWEHWGRPALHWHPGGHLASLATAALDQRVQEHLATRLTSAAEISALPLTRFRS